MGQHHRRQPSSSDYTKSWETKVAESIRQKVEQHHDSCNGNGSSSRPFMVSLSGIPGSGMYLVDGERNKSRSTIHSQESTAILCLVIDSQSQLTSLTDAFYIQEKQSAP